MLINLAIIVLMIIALWKVFVKANRPGWAVFVPFYNSYTLYKVAGKKNLFWGALAAGIVAAVAYIALIVSVISRLDYNTMVLLQQSLAVGDMDYYQDLLYRFVEREMSEIYTQVMIIMLIMIAAAIVAAVFQIIMYVKLAKSFGRGGGFAVGLVFLAPIFLCILAFSNEIVYIGNEQYDPYGRYAAYARGYGQPGYGQNQYYNQYNDQYNNQYNNQYGNPYNQQNQYGYPVYEQPAPQQTEQRPPQQHVSWDEIYNNNDNGGNSQG